MWASEITWVLSSKLRFNPDLKSLAHGGTGQQGILLFCFSRFFLWTEWCEWFTKSHCNSETYKLCVSCAAAWKPDLYRDQSVSIRIEEIKNHALHTSVSCAAKVPRVPPDCKALLQHMSSHVKYKRCCGNAEASAPLPESSSAAAKNLVYPMPGKGAAIECREVFWNKNCYHFHISKSWCTISMATRQLVQNTGSTNQ